MSTIRSRIYWVLLLAALLLGTVTAVLFRGTGPETFRVYANLAARLDDADILVPRVPLEEMFEFEGDGWLFRPNGNIQLSGVSHFWNRLTFFPGSHGGGAGKVSCRYRTQGPGGHEHALSFVVHERATATRRQRFEIVVRSDGRALIRYSEVDLRGRILKETLVAEASIPRTNGDWREYQLEVDGPFLRLTMDATVVLAEELPEELMEQVAPDGAWALELSRAGSSIYPSDALLRRLEIVRDADGGGAPLTALAFRRSPRLGDTTLRYLNFKYADTRGYGRQHGYLIKQIGLPRTKTQTEYLPALFAPGGSRYRFRLDVAPGDRLRTRYGLHQPPSSTLPASATFVVRLMSDDESKLLFSERLQTSETTRLHELDLPLPVDSPGDVVLELEVLVPGESEDGRQSALGLWGTPLVMRPRARNEPRRPNVVVISLDTLRRDHVGSHDAKPVGLLPSMTRFAESATTFTNAYTVSPWTMPSHFSLLSGRYPSNHGLNRAFGTNATAFEEVETLAQLLAAAGYVTAAIASDHSLDPVHGFDRGFYSFLDNEVRVVEPLLPSLERFLDDHGKDEFFLFFHSYDPHAPLDKTVTSDSDRLGDEVEYNDFLEIGEATLEERELVKKLYAKRVRDYDGFFGRILELLDHRGLLASSLVVFTSDHGEELFEHGGYQHGHSLYEELLQVPLIVKFPEADKMPSRVDNLTALIDVVPTLLEYLGIEGPTGIDGRSFLDVLEGREQFHRRYLLAEALAWGPERKAVVTDRYKYIVTYDGSELPDLEPRADSYDVLFDTAPGRELYDLETDPVERENILLQHAELAERLEQLLKPLVEATSRARGGVEKDPERIEVLRSLGYIQ